jgi:ABC-type nickel/cobalt efflux system permease component RcnA
MEYMVSMARKFFYSFLLSAIVCAGVVILVFTGIFDPAVFNLSRAATIFVFAAFFLTLLLIAFFCFTLRQRLRRRNSADEKQSAILNYSPEPLSHETDELEELEAVSPFLPTLPALNDNKESNDEVFELEEISNGRDGGEGVAFLFSRPFSFFSGNPEMLQEIAYDMQHDVLYEENGIHYINNNVFDSDYNGKELNSDFAQLVESVVNKM